MGGKILSFLAKCTVEQLRKVSTPFIDESTIPTEEQLKEGYLGLIAARVIMKIFYATRMVRYDYYETQRR